ncbi:LysR family transcriptional regulator [Rhizobium oryzicola]|uniref:LysR family transcriptional regulator n=1 Tax=Rhizobium oryzicola TaxID=1232668 RepID=A0ABT8T423_9HYPH|nr:LysR family transcriptional regulator [Rhizobium oryzicola]MDO1585509.1 LysR family transcriptional regulator [Rhizobium oryzicola]
MRPKISYTQLRAFNAVVQEGSFTAAAKRLGLSQPAITAQIKAIEQTHGVMLFERTGDGARMTQLAKRLFQETRELHVIEDAASDILSASSALKTGALHVMCGAPNPAMALISEYRRLYPGVRVTANFGNWQRVTTALYEQQCDAIILTGVPDDETLTRASYIEQRAVALVPSNHALAKRGTPVSLHELADQPLIFRNDQSLTQSALNRAMKKADLNLEPALSLGEREAVYEAVLQSLGIGFMFELAVSRTDNNVTRLPIVELDEVYVEHVACLSRNMRRREVRALMELAA